MNLKWLLLHIFLSTSLLLQISCISTTMNIISPASNSRITIGSVITVEWQNYEDFSTVFDISLLSNHDSFNKALLLASNVNSGTGFVSVQLPKSTSIQQQSSNNEYVIVLVNRENVSLACTGPLYLINKKEMTRISSSITVKQVTQHTFVSQSLPYIPETIHDSSLLPLSQQPYTTNMSEKNVVESLTLTSVQVAGIAMGIVACSSFVLAVYIWGKFLWNKRRERLLLGNKPQEEVDETINRYRHQQPEQALSYSHDYALSTIHDTPQLDNLNSSQQQKMYKTDNNAYFVHNGIPIPPTQAIHKPKN